MHTDQHPSLGATVPRDPRRYPRILYSAPITLHGMVAGVTRSFRGISLDVGQGGVGALVSGGPEIGEIVQIELSLRRGILRASAIVRHKSQGRAGFEFLRLGQEEQTKISEITGCA